MLGIRTDTPAGLLRAFLPTALGLIAAGLVAGAVHAATGSMEARWVAIHLLLLGGVSQLIVGVGQFFTCAFLATTPPPVRLVLAQLAAWNSAVLLVVLSVPFDAPRLAELGALICLIGLALFAAGLESMRRRSLQTAPWALRWYRAAAALLAAGALIGAALAGSFGWEYGSLLGAHITFNAVGWLGTAIVGTLHTFFPTLTGTRLRFVRLQSWTFGFWVLGTIALADGFARDSEPVKLAGLLLIAAAAALLAVNLLASLRARAMALTPAALTISAGQCALFAALLIALIAPIAGAEGGVLGGTSLTWALAGLAVWIALTVAGSLAHLLGVLAHVRRIRQGDPRFG